MDAQDVLDELVQPARLWSRAEVLARPSPVPSRPGVYGWYFKELPWSIDTSQCVTWDYCTLLYGGIAPKAPPANGQPAGDTRPPTAPPAAPAARMWSSPGSYAADHRGQKDPERSTQRANEPPPVMIDATTLPVSIGSRSDARGDEPAMPRSARALDENA
jgi:hypothetical protein